MTDNLGPKSSLLFCGLLSGVLQAGVFNFWDRALFLSLKEHRPFLDRRNFEKPFAGILQSLLQRAISGGLYFPLEDIYRKLLIESGVQGNFSQNFLAGTFAGGTNGILMNPASIVKVSIFYVICLIVTVPYVGCC
jgi:hypothetical protein